MPSLDLMPEAVHIQAQITTRVGAGDCFRRFTSIFLKLKKTIRSATVSINNSVPDLSQELPLDTTISGSDTNLGT
jgi:hypothetical protein